LCHVASGFLREARDLGVLPEVISNPKTMKESRQTRKWDSVICFPVACRKDKEAIYGKDEEERHQERERKNEREEKRDRDGGHRSSLCL